MPLPVGFLAGRTLLITGASRGIGRSIALRAAKDGANVVILAKTADPNPKLPGTIYSVAEEIEKLGGKALPFAVDIRDDKSVEKAVLAAVSAFKGIDILVNNASAISLTDTSKIEMKTYDLMNDINCRGTFLCSKMCIPYLMKSDHSHILNLSPPLSLKPNWFSNHVAYTIAKYGMSLCVLGMAQELLPHKIAVNALWPMTAIHTAATDMLFSKNLAAKFCRNTDIISDAAYTIFRHKCDEPLPPGILSKNNIYPRFWTGQFFIDENVLRAADNVSNFDKYLAVPDSKPFKDYFIDDEDDYAGVHGEPTHRNLSNEEKLEIMSKIGSQGNSDVADTFSSIRKKLSDELAKRVGHNFKIILSGVKDGEWDLDLRVGLSQCEKLADSAKTFDCTITLSEDDFLNVFNGKQSATSAFLEGKLKIQGNMAAAMKLENLIKEINKN